MLINIDNLKKQIKENETAKGFFNRVISEIELIDFDEVISELKQEQKLYEHAFLIAKVTYCCKLTDDKKYEKFIHDSILAICSATKWETQGARNGWVSDLLTGDAAINISIAFYLAKDLFSTDEQEFVQNAILEKGFFPVYNEWYNPETRIHCLDTMGHNWWAVCLGGVGVAMILADESTPDKRKYVNETAWAMREWLKYRGDLHLNKPENWGEDGDYSEYAGYMMYGITNFTVFEELYRRYTGETWMLDGTPFCRTPDYMLSFMQKIDDTYQFVKFGDTHSENSGALSMIYFANRFNRGDMVTAFNNFKYNNANPLAFIHLEKLDTEPEPIEFKPFAVYNSSGVASYKKDDIFFAVKTGDSSCHNHRDCGTFTITYKNREMIIDSGTCNYGLSEYLDYFCAPEAHNVVLFDGQGIRSDAMYGGGLHNIGRIASSVDQPHYKYLLADCTAPYTNILQKNMRHIYFIDGMILMIDDIYADHDGEAEFLLHYKGEITSDKGEYIVNNDGVKMRILPIMPKELSFSDRDGFIGVSKAAVPDKYISFKAKTENKRIRFITAYIFDSNISIAQKFNGDILELIIDRGSFTERFVVNYITDRKDVFNNPHFQHDRIKTNAFVTYLKESDGKLLSCGITNGFYLKYDDRLVYTSYTNDEVYVR